MGTLPRTSHFCGEKMRKRGLSTLIAFLLLGLSPVVTATEGATTLLAKVPGRYLKGKSNNKSYLAKIVVSSGVIKEVDAITDSQAATLLRKKDLKVIALKSSGHYDIVYPGLFDLHNHTKQNMLGLWSKAHGQFANRFEWRKWNDYKDAVSMNMNPWIKDYGKVVSCAAFRWSELQAMVLGTTFLQGPSSCVSNFAISHIEGGDSLLFDEVDSKGEALARVKNVLAPTDILDSDTFTFLWSEVKPRMKSKKKFADALEDVFFKYCPKLKTTVAKAFKQSSAQLSEQLKEAQENYKNSKTQSNLEKLMDAKDDLKREVFLDKEVLKIVTNKTLLEKSCRSYHDKFPRFMSFIYGSLAGKISYTRSQRKSGLIAHLAEGRRLDPYNRLEFELLKLVGLDQEKVNLVHAVGLDKKDFAHMAKRKMGLIWSPFSNLLLYGQTADIASAFKSGVTIALGSDWTPTGSKSVLEELKIARRYVQKMGLSKTINDEELYKMVTENSAQMINYLENNPHDGIHGAGKIVPDAVATLIVVKEKNANPYTNLVLAESSDINLVMVQGQSIYGNVNYLKEFDARVKYESMPFYHKNLKNLIETDREGLPVSVAKGVPTPKEESKEEFSKTLLKLVKSKPFLALKNSDSCDFKEKKGFVYQEAQSNDNSVEQNGDQDDDDKDSEAKSAPLYNDDLETFYQKTGLNLARAHDIEKLLGALLMTQNRNIRGIGKPQEAPAYFPSLYSCNDQGYSQRFEHFVDPKKNTQDEISTNLEYRYVYRKEQQDGIDAYNERSESGNTRMSIPESMASDYGLKYDSEEGVNGY